MKFLYSFSILCATLRGELAEELFASHSKVSLSLYKAFEQTVRTVFSNVIKKLVSIIILTDFIQTVYGDRYFVS